MMHITRHLDKAQSSAYSFRHVHYHRAIELLALFRGKQHHLRDDSHGVTANLQRGTCKFKTYMQHLLNPTFQAIGPSTEHAVGTTHPTEYDKSHKV